MGVYTDATNDGTMRALASAAKLVPYDSALFVVTDKGAGDSQRLPLALRALVEKRLKVYTIWTDPSHPSLESEIALQDLRNVSSHTEGEVLPYSLQIPVSRLFISTSRLRPRILQY
ncbi:jg17239 [Pararge aegeria aegeria]|uniref:Jg17239 protein n=1 Tax=Pararge aegeria aegeria TaxID=348720 RepID=A0A8S4R2K1_9NEOP|nr:jg17239 [Pararge aegeria aegeria]